ncbi:probable calcium-binding protein CML25 [Ziziphus jujuba]|uniref:EF-hand domain-containing protein n=2 Tax=Ziziphus jujuba TaxID=326968 RepID=A0A978UN80_ZIZJJ|nr:probable calcium-binding protein CML25 [Ziziphus jujuba]KAH7516282.1 hypothetical protein FEM48_Zijuj10G0118700 [Ziziphus jujuba var. spinosa]
MGFKNLFGKNKKKSDSPTASENDNNENRAPTPLSFPSPSSMMMINQSQIAELEEVFKKFDVNGDGKISSSELGSIMGSLGQHATDDELRKMIKEVDSDGDGFIDLNEFIELNTKGVDSKEALENLKDAFSVYDIDGNGSISAEELHKVLRSLGDECSIAECRKMISGVDCDGDGTISFEEFKIMMMMGSRYVSLDSQRPQD